MTLTATDLVAPIARYAARFHAEVGSRHHVASPLSAWLLLALAAPAARRQARAELTDVLGVAVEDAAATAAALLAQPHPLVGAAAATWHRPEVRTDALGRWLRTLPEAVETGSMPSQAEADRWASDRTLGLVRRFPLRLGDDVKLLLASALATRVSWRAPFTLAPATALGPDSRWASTVETVLRTPVDPRTGSARRAVYLASTPEAGDVAVHTVWGCHDERNPAVALHVTSVIAAPHVAPAHVVTAAYGLATAPMRGAVLHQWSLFDLPLGNGPAWTITEEQADAAPGRPERYSAALPAWSAEDEHDLAAAAFGFAPAAGALIALLPPNRYRWQARQSAMARYNRIGFEAAAVTGFAARTSAQHSPSGKNRVAEVRFGHPYAVVAVASDTRWDPNKNE